MKQLSCYLEIHRKRSLPPEDSTEARSVIKRVLSGYARLPGAEDLAFSSGESLRGRVLKSGIEATQEEPGYSLSAFASVRISESLNPLLSRLFVQTAARELCRGLGSDYRVFYSDDVEGARAAEKIPAVELFLVLPIVLAITPVFLLTYFAARKKTGETT